MWRAGVLFAAIALAALSAVAQVPTIVKEIGDLEGVRDPKCYATAGRLEDFIYGTPLETGARFEKIALQKQYIRDVWVKATAAATAAGRTSIDVERLRPILQAAVPYVQTKEGNWIVRDTTTITARDKRQYGSVAYALRAILSVQQDALVDGTKLLPLDDPAVQLFKESIDLITLTALQAADRQTRTANRDRIAAPDLRAAWKEVVKSGEAKPAPARRAQSAQGDKFATIKAIVGEKLAAFEKYNDLAFPVFLRNIQVYMARHMWPSDSEEGKRFKDQFTETMIAWTGDVMLEAEKRAKKAGHPLIRVEDADAAVQHYEPHELNRYEDCIYFPRLSHDERIVIEAYDLDAFRDPGLHWLYLNEVLKDPKYKGTMEPDPFAAELLTEGGAQMGTLILRVAGRFAEQEGADRLSTSHLTKAVARIQTLLDKHASLPPLKKASKTIPSAPSAQATKAGGTYFANVTEGSGVKFEHRMSDWLARFIRSYSVTENNTVRLAVPPAFGGSGIAAEDIDNDGDIDILILGGAGNALYFNDGKGHFTDVTESSGLRWTRPDGTYGEPRQPIIADFDNDGLQDILITYVDDAHRLYRNLGNAHFEDVTERAGLGGKGLVGGPATAFDFDGDGRLDLYIGYFGDYVHGVLPTLSRRNSNALPDKLFHNKGNFVFEDVSAGSGVENVGWAQAVGHLDFDGDGREDLICGNDFGVNAWYRNLGNGKFEDVSAKIGTDKPSYTMGLGIADLNRDSYPDVYITNIVTMDKDEKYVLPDDKTRMKFNPAKMANARVFEANDLFTSVSDGKALVSYEQSKAVGRGYKSTGWSWGANFFDFDNDGDDDLYVLNGMNEYAVYSSVNPYLTDASGAQRNAIMPVAEKESPVFFVNRNGRLLEESAKSGANPLGNARSVAQADFDGDGRLDMAVNNFNMPAMVYRNNVRNGNHWIAIRLTGDPAKGVTRDAIGAQIRVDTAHEKGLWREVFSTIGYLTVNPKEQHLGLGRDTKADVTIRWPNGEVETHKGLAADKRYHFTQGTKQAAK
ncbi:MAG TPA: CRTAC1 family protein [Thermoanaerobaculia bacterium]|nr:CRTAC1 family protein [Thermoanaerobaculia bacterium]